MGKERKVFKQETFVGKLSQGKDCVLISEEIETDRDGRKGIEIRSTDVGGFIESTILPFNKKEVKLTISVTIEEV
jgi:hypothetical protein